MKVDTHSAIDPEFEKTFNCNVEKALASPNRGTVLKVNILIIVFINIFYAGYLFLFTTI